jgi:hypothetical protein
VASVEQVFPACGGAVSRLRACAAAHPAGSATAGACNHFGALLGWCVSRQLCGRQTARLEACCGGIPEVVGCSRRLCAREDAALDQCMRQFTGEG